MVVMGGMLFACVCDCSQLHLNLIYLNRHTDSVQTPTQAPILSFYDLRDICSGNCNFLSELAVEKLFSCASSHMEKAQHTRSVLSKQLKIFDMLMPGFGLLWSRSAGMRLALFSANQV